MRNADPIISLANLVSVVSLALIVTPVASYLQTPSASQVTIPRTALAHSWSECPTIRVHLDSRDASLEKTILEAIDYLRTETGLNLTYKGTTRTPQIESWLRTRPGTIGISSHTDAFVTRPRNLGLAFRTFDVETGHITAAFIALNLLAIPDTATAIRTLMHELGHALGLGHGGAQGDLMYPSIDKHTNPRLDVMEIAVLRSHYHCQ